MSDPSRESALRANAALDGELDAANALEFERELARDPDLRALHARLGAARDAVRRSAPRESAPEALRERVLRLAEVAEPPARRRMRFGDAPRALAASLALVARFGDAPRALAASLALVAVIGALAWMFRVGGGEDPRLQALVSGYMRAQVSGQPFDVASSDRHTVKPWLAARVTLGAQVLDLAPAGYPLAGGRIDIVDHAPVPTLVYRRREHFISVSELPLRDAHSWRGAVEGYHVESWADAERAYVAVSDIDAPELADFAEAFRRADQPDPRP
jgi:anti-sigma factor RsiW